MSVIKSALFLSFYIVYSYGDSSIYPYDLTVEYLKNPLAVEVLHPRLSWKLIEVPVNGSIPRNLSQTAYQILASSNSNLEEKPDLWDTGKVKSDLQTNIPYEGKAPGYGKRIYWTVRVWDQHDNVSSFAKQASWDVGHSPKWTALWISAPDDLQKQALANISAEDKAVVSERPGLKPVVHLRKEFSVDSEIKEAKVFATALGLYRIFVNSELDVPLFSPGWTDYTQSLQYQAYDVTPLIRSKNAIAVKLGTGWFSGYVGFNGEYGNYGNKEAFLMELHIEFVNGTKVVIGTDETWKVSTGPIIYSDILQGELYYEDRSLGDWKNPGYDDKKWQNVNVSDVFNKNINLIADRGQAVGELERRLPISAWESEPGVWVYDFGVNYAGYVEIELENFTSQARVQVRHAEALYPNGSVYTENLRKARAIDTYVLSDPNISTKLLKPHFSYHGFRYAEVTGIPTQLKNIRSIRIGIEGINNNVTTDNKLVNTLVDNIRNSLLANLISVPTDCPQRDERLGWMADAQIIIETAIYNGNVAAFMTKWMRDVREAQSQTTGAFSDVSPRLVEVRDGSPSWGDAGIIVTWHLYRMYGDVRIIEENFESMQRQIEYIHKANPNLLWLNSTNINWGDWLSFETTVSGVFSTAFFAYDALLLSKMSKAIGKNSEAEEYKNLHSNISEAFIKEFVNTADGKIRGDTQTSYVLPVVFDMLPVELRIKAVKNLVANIKRNDWHLTTGFAGVGFLLPVLSEYGYDDVAYKLIQQTTVPSWGYMIVNNATSLWERWDGYTKDKGFQDPGMNSFNHYALGSVGRWIYQYLAGIGTDDTEVGFKKIIIKPHIGQGVNHTVAWYSSPKGTIGVEWHQLANSLDLLVTIPVNAKAEVIMTFAGKTWIRHVQSGTYQYSIPRN